MEEIGMDHKWQERFPTQPELERYVSWLLSLPEHTCRLQAAFISVASICTKANAIFQLNEVVDYLGIRDNFVLNTRIKSAHYDESKNIWHVTTSKGEAYTCDFLVTAAGPLSTPLKPPFPGLDKFKGKYFQTAIWPDKKVDFTGKRVGIFGTGATVSLSSPTK